MQNRAVRRTLVVVLLIVGAGAGFSIWDIDRRLDTLTAAERDVDIRLDRLIVATTDVALGQQAYVAPGRIDGETFQQVSSLVQQIYTETTGLAAVTLSSQAADRLLALRVSLEKLIEVDGRIRHNLRLDQILIAADTISGDASELTDRMHATVQALRSAERAAVAAERDILTRQASVVLGSIGTLWALGLLALARVPAVRLTAPVSDTSPSSPSIATTPEPAPAPPAVDLSAAADVCTSIARLSSPDGLPDLLARASTILDASGLIVWMGAGDELFAVSAHGYDPRIVSRLGPIGRNADNATAAAWRTGELRTVEADRLSNGAIVAPLLGPERCIGVLAAEVRRGRENEVSVQAITTMIAAQLASALATGEGAEGASERGADELEASR